MHRYLTELYREGLGKEARDDPRYEEFRRLMVERKIQWRKSSPVVRLERPLRIDKARRYGYKAKQGFIAARARVRKGGRRKSRPVKGRKPAGMGVKKITPAKSIQRMAEERTQRKFPNLEVLASYWLWEDGQYKWYEVILLDPNHPVIKKDNDVSWITEKQHKGRVFRGLTPSGKKGRGLRKRGMGAEKLRPSIRAKGRRAK
ncbi:MAG: 50S ribosomal protein L15e [Candidatus Altiarchaeales archaeon WOR_SM1_86-2]|nr:MAG: 50S ribosomal protein L15e [Candidatus Altiarchaeales archaeon WOR_SM1_86-2]